MQQHPASSPSRTKLGLLNGAYEVQLSNGEPGEIIPCLQGTSIWGSFELFETDTHGIFYLPERSWVASADPRDSHKLVWRGVDENGDVRVDDGCQGWIPFLGDGEISGNICELDPRGYDYEFDGRPEIGFTDCGSLAAAKYAGGVRKYGNY